MRVGGDVCVGVHTHTSNVFTSLTGLTGSCNWFDLLGGGSKCSCEQRKVSCDLCTQRHRKCCKSSHLTSHSTHITPHTAPLISHTHITSHTVLQHPSYHTHTYHFLHRPTAPLISHNTHHFLHRPTAPLISHNTHHFLHRPTAPLISHTHISLLTLSYTHQ